MDDFSQMPRSVTEERANRTSSAAAWTPRDALIDILRRIDSGELSPVVMVVCYRDDSGEGPRVSYNNSSPDIHTTLGVLTRVMGMINR